MFHLFNIFNTFPLLNNPRNSEQTTTFLSLVLIVLIFLLFVLKMVQLASHTSVTAAVQTNYEFDPPITTLSTSFDDQNNAPFMAAFSLTNDVTCGGLIKVDVTASISVGTYNTSNRTTSKVSLGLENCSQSHFSTLPGGISKLKEWAEAQLYCLPLNKYYELGGSNKASSIYKTLVFSFSCPASCSSSPSCGTVQLFTLNSNVNVYNSSAPFAYSLDRRTFSVQPAPTLQYALKIDAISLTSDDSLLPFSRKRQMSGNGVGQFVSDIPAGVGSTSSILTVERSDRTVVYSRSYLRLFDVVAYVGGVFQSVVILFWFVRVFLAERLALEMAKLCFKTAEAKNYHLGSFAKQTVFRTLKWINCEPRWELAQKRSQLQSRIAVCLDVYYLNKRIQFLEDAISLLFEKYQLKGLHLIQTLSSGQAGHRINDCRLRDRLLTYLSKSKVERKGMSQQGEGEDGLNSHHQLQSHQLHSTSKKQESSTIKKLIQQTKLIYKRHSSLKAMENGRKANRISFPKLFELDENNRLSVPSQIRNEAEDYYSSEDTYNQQFKTREKLQNELSIIGQMTPEELDEAQLVRDLETDLKRLMEEGAKKDGDTRARRIVERLEQWLQSELKEAVARKPSH